MEEKPNYFAVIPAEVRYDSRLRANEKLLYGEITALTYKTGECWASNNYFSKLYETSPQAISRWILNLKKYGYLTIEYEYKGKEIEKRIIKVSTYIDRYQQNDDRGINKCLEGYQQKVKENNTSINNTSINNTRYYDDDELDSLFKDYLKQRKQIKAVNSDRAIKVLLNKLESYPDETKKKMIEESIANSWKSIYPLKENERSKPQDFKRPAWLDMDL